MNEEKRPTFPDKYHLSRKESVYLLKKNIVELVYNAGKFEGLDLSQYLGHILVETVTSFLLLPTLQTPVGLDSESSYGFDFGYKTLQCS